MWHCLTNIANELFNLRYMIKERKIDPNAFKKNEQGDRKQSDKKKEEIIR